MEHWTGAERAGYGIRCQGSGINYRKSRKKNIYNQEGCFRFLSSLRGCFCVPGICLFKWLPSLYEMDSLAFVLEMRTYG